MIGTDNEVRPGSAILTGQELGHKLLVIEARAYLAGLKLAVKDGLKGVIEYAATHPVSENNWRLVARITTNVVESLKSKPSEFVGLLNDENPGLARTAGVYMSELLTKGSINKKELRETEGFADALASMKARGDADSRQLAFLLEVKARMMEPVDSRKRAPSAPVGGIPGQRSKRRATN